MILSTLDDNESILVLVSEYKEKINYAVAVIDRYSFVYFLTARNGIYFCQQNIHFDISRKLQYNLLKSSERLCWVLRGLFRNKLNINSSTKFYAVRKIIEYNSSI